MILPPDLLDREIAAICATYRITPPAAHAAFMQQLSRRPDLLKKIPVHASAQEIGRLRAYKDLIKDIRKHIYYHLRQYQPDQTEHTELRAQLAERLRAGAAWPELQTVRDQLLLTHVSTRERVAAYPAFYQMLFALLPAPRRIIDVGCGLHPLSYPFGEAAYRPELYVAVDNQSAVIETLQMFAPAVHPTRLHAEVLEIATADWTTLTQDGATFEVAFLLKLIPVLARQQRELLPKLAAIPARILLITASNEALTRHTNIKRREDRILHEFIAVSGKVVVQTVEFGNEFGYFLSS